MSDWTKKLFIENADSFLKIMEERWSRTEELVNGMVKILANFGITSGNLLDLCCGNGRVSIYMAKKGFKAIGVDISKVFIEDAKRKAKTYKVSGMVTFLQGDVKNLKKVVGCVSQPFDVVVNVWTSIGYSSPEDDLKIFKQARELSREGAILFIAETMPSEHILVKFTPTSYMEVGDIVVLENRTYDPTTSQLKTVWAFYRKWGEDLKFVDKIKLTIHVYNVSELSTLLRKADWEPTAFYGSLATLQPMNALSSLNIVAKAV
ncbi:methyltransferase domain-containing protein [Candidatus Bathyarchaeota archaeon]|nr:methyltransferase domain-containing protein [Candidatus Bathyarchaeota archaeon]